MDYFIRRRNGVLGPYGLDTIHEKMRTNQFQGLDEISESRKGPWRSIAQWNASLSEPTEPEMLVAVFEDAPIGTLGSSIGTTTLPLSGASGENEKGPPAIRFPKKKKSKSPKIDPIHEVKPSGLQKAYSFWHLNAGFFYGFVSIVLPIQIYTQIISLGGFFYGIKNIVKGNTITGIVQVAISLLSGCYWTGVYFNIFISYLSLFSK